MRAVGEEKHRVSREINLLSHIRQKRGKYVQLHVLQRQVSCMLIQGARGPQSGISIVLQGHNPAQQPRSYWSLVPVRAVADEANLRLALGSICAGVVPSISSPICEERMGRSVSSTCPVTTMWVLYLRGSTFLFEMPLVVEPIRPVPCRALLSPH